MREKPRNINIETLTTPKGDVPTVKGLEQAINSALSNFQEDVKILEEKLDTITSTLNDQSDLISNLGSSFSELIVSLGKIDQKNKLHRSTEANTRIVKTIDLLSLKEEISLILNKIEHLLPTITE
ncbi:MAG: hypothetical protein KAT16_00895 [Candidatus Heimdallarchaeota archaeon]|nr:hypothetical protein [Candidatus Heimdallarchaeota archaeon]